MSVVCRLNDSQQAIVASYTSFALIKNTQLLILEKIIEKINGRSA